MSKFKLAIGLHNHQPIGNFESVFEEAHRLAYAPFLNLMEQFKSMRIALHQSGILWDWQERNHPEYLETVRRMIADDRLEMMTGGFYEPILPSIPDRDKLGQIGMLNRYLKDRFGAVPEGLWLTERVWEPQLPKVLGQAGVKYLPIDDTHFIYAGFEPEQLRGVFVTEEEGVTVRLLPIQKRLRYLIPFGQVPEVIDELKRQAEQNPGGLAVYADDGEKFGVWPKTHEHCYEDGWLEDFFTALADNADWLEVCPLGEAAAMPPVGNAYLQSASYAEMLHWSLPPKAFAEYEAFETWLKKQGQLDRFGRFVRGGHWRGFLAKYPESNLMHKKMLAVSDHLAEFERKNPKKTDIIEQARDHLYAGQCNCPYWHGVFGGLYLPHLRQTIYERLIRAEAAIRPPKTGTTFEKRDYDCDGHDEVLVTTAKFSTIIRPGQGGMMLELDGFDGHFNYCDTLSRRREGYHWKLAKATVDGEKAPEGTASIHDLVMTKEKGLEKFLADDWYLRRCFVDHFFEAGLDIDGFLTGRFRDEGNFVLEPYMLVKKPAGGALTMERVGHIRRTDVSRRLRIEKRFTFAPESEVIAVNYSLTALDDNIDQVRLAVENNFNFQAGHTDNRYFLFDGKQVSGGYLDQTVSRSGCRSVIMRDDWRDLAVGLLVDRPADIWQVPIFTISLSEGGFEKVYQGTSIVHIITADLKVNRPFEISFMLFAGRPAGMPPRFLREITGAAVVE